MKNKHKKIKKMRLLDIMRRYVAPNAMYYVTFDSYRRQIQNPPLDLESLKKLKDSELTAAALQEELELWFKQQANEELQNKIEGWSSLWLQYNNLKSQFDIHKSRLEELEKKFLEKNSTPSGGENLESLNTEKIEVLSKIRNLEDQDKILQTKLSEIINKSDISEFLSKLLEKYQLFISDLSLEQLVALTNIIGYFMILFTIINISTIVLGDYLIEKLNLETRFPSLSNLIRIKQKLNKGYLTFYVALLYIFVIVSILTNIYMLLLKYLV